MIAIKENGVIYLAYSPVSMYCWGNSDEKTLLEEENLFTFVADEERGVIVGVSRYMPRADAIRYNLKGCFNLDVYMMGACLEVQKKIDEIFEKKGFYNGEKQREKNEKTKIFIAQEDRGFIYNPVDKDWIALDDGMNACISNDLFESAYDACYEIEDIYEKIKQIFRLFGRQVDEIVFPVVVLDTKTKKHRVIWG